jgi:malate synthase
MIMLSDNTILAALIAGLVAVVGTMATYRRGQKDAAARRMESAWNFNQDIVEDLRAERYDLKADRGELSERIAALENDIRELRETVMGLRQSEAALASWAIEIMDWAGNAVTEIRSLGGTINEPPPPPHHP